MTRLAPCLALLLVACGGPSDDIQGFDPNVDPVTTGPWYRPTAATTWQWQLTGTVNTSYDVEVYDVDLFDSPQSLIDGLHTDGRKVVCYFSAGSSEDWRADFEQFDRAHLGKNLDGWPGEKWLDIRQPAVLTLMEARLDLAASKGCDGVEPDNVDGYTNNTGFSLTADDQLGFNRRLANAAHEKGLAVGLKNSGDQAGALVDYFDFEVNEECHQYDECGQLSPFPTEDKPVWNAEYPGSETKALNAKDGICAAALAANLRTLLLPLNLDDSFRVSCD